MNDPKLERCEQVIKQYEENQKKEKIELSKKPKKQTATKEEKPKPMRTSISENIKEKINQETPKKVDTATDVPKKPTGVINREFREKQQKRSEIIRDKYYEMGRKYKIFEYTKNIEDLKKQIKKEPNNKELKQLLKRNKILLSRQKTKRGNYLNFIRDYYDEIGNLSLAEYSKQFN